MESGVMICQSHSHCHAQTVRVNFYSGQFRLRKMFKTHFDDGIKKKSIFVLLLTKDNWQLSHLTTILLL